MNFLLNNFKKILILIAIILFQQMLIGSNPKTSAGHPGSTGAPNELTCAQSNCHSDATVNPGDLINSLVFNSGDSLYTPGTTYTLAVKIEKAGIAKFGFELVALKNNDNSNIGLFTVTDAIRTQIINGVSPNPSRKYITHKTDGTIPSAPNVGEWIFNWTAPPASSGPITFYYTTNATNNNNQNTGDEIFLSSFEINESTTGINEDEKEIFSVFFSKASAKLYISYANLKATSNTARIEIRDLQGKLIQSDQLNSILPIKNKAINLNENITTGIYLVTYRVDNKMLSRKIYIEK